MSAQETTPGHGGRRRNAGRKPAAIEAVDRDHYTAFKAAQAKREEHRAVLAELEVRQKQAELVEASAVRRDADRAARIVRDTLLALPDRVAALLIGLDERQMATVLRNEVKAALLRISEAATSK